MYLSKVHCLSVDGDMDEDAGDMVFSVVVTAVVVTPVVVTAVVVTAVVLGGANG